MATHNRTQVVSNYLYQYDGVVADLPEVDAQKNGIEVAFHNTCRLIEILQKAIAVEYKAIMDGKWWGDVIRYGVLVSHLKFEREVVASQYRAMQHK